MSVSALEQSIFQTVRYYALFDCPVTAVQVWRSLIVVQPGIGLRWQGQSQAGLTHVTQTLRQSAWLEQRLGSHWGYYYVRGSEASVERRLRRHVLAQHKWKIVRRVGRWLAFVPLVRMIAVSGSLAQSNTKAESDLDLFVIVHAGRIWTARLLLLAAAQFTGRRRKHWDSLAPDKVCLNHYVSDRHLLMTREVRNLYTAVQYAALAPLVGGKLLPEFWQANGAWLRRFVMAPAVPALPHRMAVRVGPVAATVHRGLTALFLEPIGGALERWAERVQRQTVARHSRPGQAGRVALGPHELAFHPDSRVQFILEQFAQEPGQQALL